MQKMRYELDPYNRLVLDRAGKKSDLGKFRQVLDGKFKTDGNNNLSYHVKSPLSGESALPNQIKLSGTWSLTDRHELCLTLDKSARGSFGDRILVRGEILDVRGDSLLFGLTTTSKDDTRSTYVLQLSGSWKADGKNRLSFHVTRESGKKDVLTFTGAWEIGEEHESIYRYERSALKRKKREAHALTFKGYWDISGKARVSYVLSADTDSMFEFKTSIGMFKENYIRYEIGIGASGDARQAQRKLIFTGKWNLRKDVGLAFDIEYGKRRPKALVFGADIRLAGTDTVTFRLMGSSNHKDLGASVELSRAILGGDGEAFLRVLASRQESALYAGAAWRW